MNQNGTHPSLTIITGQPTNKPASFVKLLPLISTKTPKEVNEISNFFKKNNKLTKKKDTGRSYA